MLPCFHEYPGKIYVAGELLNQWKLASMTEAEKEIMA